MKLIDTSQNWIGLSTDTKPTAPAPGSSFFEGDYFWEWVYNGFAWVPRKILIEGITAQYKQISLNQAANTYDVMTATTQNLFIDAIIIHVPDNLSAVETFTGISVQTDDVAAIEILSAAAGAKAKLTGNFYHVYRGPKISASTKKIQLTIGGATAGAGKVADITVLWRPVVAGGYYLNA
ncbi:MAG: hypothetical protein PHF12_05235 [Candidatus Omnitrophica bacterium]|nr:hypothetical protein [Candidatus Omnitrophota bacterium]